MHSLETDREPGDQPDVPPTPPDEPTPPPVQDPPAEPVEPPYVVCDTGRGAREDVHLISTLRKEGP
jgi:hypothetical protein